MSAVLAQPALPLADNLKLSGTVPKALEVPKPEKKTFPAPGPMTLPDPPPPPPSPYEQLKQRLIARIRPYGTYWNSYAPGNCTFYVASRIAVPGTLGNADTWDQLGINSEPLVGAIAQTDAGWAGHVALVEAVSNGMVMVSEMNVWGYNVIDTLWYPAYHFSYIY